MKLIGVEIPPRNIYLLNELQIKYKHIVLAHAMPESLSLVLGMAIENWNLTITQYNPKLAIMMKSTYEPD